MWLEKEGTFGEFRVIRYLLWVGVYIGMVLMLVQTR